MELSFQKAKAGKKKIFFFKIGKGVKMGDLEKKEKENRRIAWRLRPKTSTFFFFNTGAKLQRA